MGHAFSDRIDTYLTLAAIDMAYRRCKPDKSLIIHSDRGAQYTPGTAGDLLHLSEHGPQGEPYGNAVAENCFSCLKFELLHLK